jgi:type 2 lantibiotic biosynthesis protein LanM
MTLENSNRARWMRGMTLEERRAGVEGGSSEIDFDRERALRRLEKWRSQPGFEDPSRFARRLALDGLTEESLLPLLGESDESLARRIGRDPEWLREIAAAFEATPAEEPLCWPVRSPDHPTEFLNLVEPIARAGLARLVDAIRELPGDHPPEEAEARRLALLFLGNLGDRLRGLLTRTLVLEIQVARLEGTLPGATPAERYRSFVESLRDHRTALDLLERYPVLARQVVLRVHQWERASLEVLQRLVDDREVIRETFAGGADPGELVEVRGGLSDPHRGGRTVLILRFASGLRLVYKPKSLAVDVAFQRLLAWVNARGFDAPYRTLQVLDRGDYGWVEFVTPGPCESPDQVERFYRRQGGYLALLYLLEGTDFHLENLVASGEHPVLIDLETLFHARVNVPDLHRQEDRPGRSTYDSVLRVGLLPERIWGDDESAGVDLSGLGSPEEQETKPFWNPVALGTDEMRYEKVAQRMAPVDNRPSLDGAAVGADGYREEIEGGLRDLYRLLAAHREELGSPDGPLAAFSDTEVRVVFRPTRGYAMLMMEGFHPQVQGDALDHQRLLDRLWSGAAIRPYLERLVPYEVADLQGGDIPFFVTRPASRDLWTGGGERIADLFPETGIDRALRRLAALSEDDLERQAFLTRATLGILTLESGRGERSSFDLAETAEPATPADLVDAARAVARRLRTLAFREGEEARWYSVQALGPGRWALLEAPPDLYLGTPGIALFLAHLGLLADDPESTRLAEAALATLRRQVEETSDGSLAIGGFNGWGGSIHALTHIGILWHDDGLLAEAEALVPRLAAAIRADESHDFLSGAAGGLLALLGLHDARPSVAAREAAVACGEHLLARARPMKNGAGWVMKDAGQTPLAGLSHGAAGIALALLHLARETGDERFRGAALDGLAYERSLYDPERRNWPDLREGAAEMAALHGEGDEHFMCAFCHGAAGIGLARVAGLSLLDDDDVRGEIRTAVATTLAEGFGDNHSLCHGALGNLDFLLQAARALDDLALEQRVLRMAGGVLHSIERDGWLYGLARGAEPVGLMVGLAGIGYGLLRLADPGTVPSVLTLGLPIEESDLPGAYPGTREPRPVGRDLRTL